MSDGLKAFFADTDAAVYHNLQRGIMSGYVNQIVTYTLDADSSDQPPCLLTIWEGDKVSGKEPTSEYIYMTPADARDIATVLTAYADAWGDKWHAHEGGKPHEWSGHLAPETTKWLPIGTAPRDGTDILICWSSGHIWAAHFDRATHAWWVPGIDTNGSDLEAEFEGAAAVYWMPLPALPRGVGQ